MVVLHLPASSTFAQDEGEPEEPAAPEGLLPLPDYGGDMWARRYLLGDLGGARSDFAAKGIQFGVDWTQTVQGVVDGGRDETTRYNGSLDYNLNLDLQKMGVAPGGLITFRAESNYGNDVNGASGLLLPVNTDAFFPLTDDDDIPFTITALNYTQFLSPQFGVFAGKIDTLDGDLNEFASGRGVTQFQNAQFVFNSVAALTVPYSTLATGVFWQPSPNVRVSSSIMNTEDSSTTTGFGDFGEGYNWMTEVQFQYKLGDLPGGQAIGFQYSGDADFASLDNLFVFERGVGISLNTADDTWFLSWNGWQYLWTAEPAGDAPMNLINRVPDLRGFGLFARAGVADEDTNPVEWSVSGGLGGRGIIPGRESDIFGIGYYYNSIQPDRLTGILGIDDYSHGFEAFYNIALTPAAYFTVDVQVAEDPFPRTDTAVIVGGRLQLSF